MPKVKTPWQGLKPNPSKYFGFCYRITDTLTSKMYIGKKQYWGLAPKRTRKKPVADLGGKWQPQHWVSTNWETYTGSCSTLNEDIAAMGYGQFKFEIISQHQCLGDLTYAEVEWLVKSDTLILRDKDGERKYYNGNIMAIRFIPPNKTSEVLDGCM